MSQELNNLLNSDPRFTKRGAKFQKLCNSLSSVISDPSIATQLNDNVSYLKNLIWFINILQNANSQGDSVDFGNLGLSGLQEVLQKGPEVLNIEVPTATQLKDSLGRNYLDYKSITVESAETSKPQQLIDTLTKPLELLATTSVESTQIHQTLSDSGSSILWPASDTNFWIHSVDLDFPMYPQFNSDVIVYEHLTEHHHYAVYADAGIPWIQSQISCVTDVNRFSDQDILNLFPPIRLYTRSRYMYQKYENLDFDEDLGVIFSISGYTKKQIRKNLIEYPHLDGVDGIDRIVKRKGIETTIPFWKHIELDGEIHKTSEVWNELKDTKKLPKTDSFMREYVVRRYILEETVKGIEHKYPMRGTFMPFLTLYNTPEYYEQLGYDPLEIGRKCVVARQSYKYTRNPIIKMINDAQVSAE